MLGYDTLFINPVEDAELVRIAEAEGRIVLSSDRRLFERSGLRSGRVRGLLLDNYQDHGAQLHRIVDTFGLNGARSFVRCLECNTLFVARSREEAKGQVPSYVYQTLSIFVYCPRCNQFFWEGEHVKRMRRLIGQLERRLNETEEG